MKDEFQREMLEIGTYRHQAHCSNDYDEWVKNINIVIDLLDEMKIANKLYIPEYIDCGRDDCSIVNCHFCNEAEKDFLFDNKDKYNAIIEDIMNKYDEDNETEYAPTGESRANWCINN